MQQIYDFDFLENYCICLYYIVLKNVFFTNIVFSFGQNIRIDKFLVYYKS